MAMQINLEVLQTSALLFNVFIKACIRHILTLLFQELSAVSINEDSIEPKAVSGKGILANANSTPSSTSNNIDEVKCSQCKKKFASKVKLRRHLLKRHKVGHIIIISIILFGPLSGNIYGDDFISYFYTCMSSFSQNCEMFFEHCLLNDNVQCIIFY